MPSLKDLRNRIASVKATQKITKAMQMVAAAKLRRAQEAAEAARPYSQRMAGGAGQYRRRGVGWRRYAPPDDGYRLGRHASARRLHGRARALRRVQFADRPPCPRPCAQADSGRQDGQDPVRRQEGLRYPSPRILPARSSTGWTLREVKQIGFVNAQDIAREGASSCSTRASSMSAHCSIPSSNR